MPTPRSGYYLNGKRLPSVTTVLKNLGWGSDALRHKAVELTREGLDYEAEWGRAAQIGTCTHAMVDAHLNENTFILDDFPADIVDAALVPYQSFRNWSANNPVDLVESEFPLVSSAMRVGGTPDFLVRMGRDLVLIDIKTSNWVFPAHVIQVVSYMDMIEECRGTHVDYGILLRIGKDGTSSVLKVDGEMVTNARASFYHLLELHKLKGPLEAVTKAVNKPGAIPRSAELTLMGKAVA